MLGWEHGNDPQERVPKKKSVSYGKYLLRGIFQYWEYKGNYVKSLKGVGQFTNRKDTCTKIQQEVWRTMKCSHWYFCSKVKPFDSSVLQVILY